MEKSAKSNVKTIKNNVKNENNVKNNNNEVYFYSEDEDKVIVDFVNQEFEKRRLERKPFDLAWELNINFLIGNQFSYIADNGEIEKTPKQYYWQGEEVFNHISPIIETRLAKLAKVRPTFAVKPSSTEQRDVYCAKLSKAVLGIFSSRSKLSDVISKATTWSEVTGTAFYKVAWNSSKGAVLGKKDDGETLTVGDVELSVCSPFEIFPDSVASDSIDACSSLIHAKPVPATFIKDEYGVIVDGTDIDTFSFDQASSSITFSGRSNAPRVSRSIKHDHVLLIEYYEKPSKEYPNGKFVVIAGNKLLFDGELPFENLDEHRRGFPFVRQVSLEQIGSFWGTSVIERCIPIQRAFNLVKNRKHEFMARLASGVLAVEDGSVDLDLIEEEGLAPGKIVVYRNGSTPPAFMNPGSIPNEFDYEEDRLLNEFTTVSGVSELMRDSTVPTSLTSGTALSLLIEQDETRLSVSAEYIRSAVLLVGEQVLRLYKQFANADRLIKFTDENGEIEIYYWNNGDISYEEVVLESTNELTESPAQRKNMLFDLYKSGLFVGDDGKINSRTRAKIIEALGFNSFENIQDLSSMHIKKATEENLKINGKLSSPLDVDDHEIHILEHTKFILSGETRDLDAEHEQDLLNHILEHKVMRFADVSSKNLGDTQTNINNR